MASDGCMDAAVACGRRQTEAAAAGVSPAACGGRGFAVRRSIASAVGWPRNFKTPYQLVWLYRSSSLNIIRLLFFRSANNFLKLIF